MKRLNIAVCGLMFAAATAMLVSCQDIVTYNEGDPKVKDFKGSSFFVWITPDGHNERMNA